MQIPQTAIQHPSAWRSADFAGPDDYSIALTSDQVKTLLAAAEAVRDSDLGAIDRLSFDLDSLSNEVAAWREEVLFGRGFIILKGLPRGEEDLPLLERLYWGLGCYFGQAVSQSLMGDRLGHIVSVSGDNREERGYRSNRELRFHCDSDDVVGMYCLSQGASGGGSKFVSALAVFNALLASDRDLLQPLFEGFRYHWRGEQAPGEPPITEYQIPVLSQSEGILSVCYLRDFIEMAAEDLVQPLTDLQMRALDRFDALCEDPAYKLEVVLEPGDLIFLNNYTMLHGRLAFQDAPEQGARRHLMRLWLKAGVRPLHPAVRRYYGEDGLPQQEGKGTLYKRGEDSVNVAAAVE